ncbi:hypothetical protein GGI19_002689 [Coemansia pectinata]|uniref:RNase H type-1 domain-containing protein n=1 Tax=Coemansia pectinata TaxID=1052879 RepID=A0A9W8H131_9FUNG|nr:hypothetical protein GGI19_002689 [Coemansia pectinata]
MADSGTPNDGPPLETTQQEQLGDVEEDREHMVGMSDQLRQRLELIVELEADAVKIQKGMDELAEAKRAVLLKEAVKKCEEAKAKAGQVSKVPSMAQLELEQLRAELEQSMVKIENQEKLVAQLQTVLEGPANIQETVAELFLAEKISQRFRELDIAGLAASATRIEIYTDGSLQPGTASRPAQMGFAAIFQFHVAGETIKEVTVAGATMDGPFSLTMAEMMAIVATLAALPSDAKATVWCDSQAAIAYTRLLQKKSDNSWRKSPQAYMAQFHIDRIGQ